MLVYFGIVKNYLPEKGFGFVQHPLSLGPDSDVFFHITNVEKHDKDAALELSLYKTGYESSNNISFWYVAETTQKGEQLKRILSPQEVYNSQPEVPNELRNKVKSIWSDIKKPIPFWLSQVTNGLFGSYWQDELILERKALIQKRDEQQEKLCKEEDRLRKIEEEKAKIEQAKRAEERRRYEEKRAKARKEAEEERKRQREKKERQEKIEEEEFELLVAEMKSKEFTKSAEVSIYIVEHRLGYKYKNISGILEMSNSMDTWKFKGGFPAYIYARLCQRLNLENQGSDARPGEFTPFKDLDD